MSKYLLSKEGMDKLMKKLENIAKEEFEKNIIDEKHTRESMLEAEITTDFLNMLIKVNDISDIIENNEFLTTVYRGLIDMYGFDNMYDMYVYAMSCDHLTNSISKSKDYSKLVPVKRTITRNGKETEVTVWIKPDEDKDREEDKKYEPKSRQRMNTRRRRKKARELPSRIIGGDSELNPKELAKIKLETKEFKGNKPFEDNCKYYLEIKDDEGKIIGVVGYSELDGYLTMDFYMSNGEVSGVASKGFFELLNLAVDKGKGVKMENNESAVPLFIRSGLVKNGDYWLIEYKDLKSIMEVRGPIQ